MLKLIVSMTKDRIIGVEGKLPWKYSEDLRRFRRMTLGGTVIMGRKTWDSIPEHYRPLVGRLNIILSRDKERADSHDHPNLIFFPDLVGALKFTKEHLPPKRDTWIIGGGEIYREALENVEINVEHLDIVTVPDTIPVEGATLFPEVNLDKWILTTHYKAAELLIETYRKI